VLAQKKMTVTKADEHLLTRMIESHRASLRTLGDPYDSYLRALENQLAEASVVPEMDVDEDVITMNSKVCVREMDTGRCKALTLVYRPDPDSFGDTVSVIAPLGASVLGARVGDIIEWQTRRTPRQLRIERILFQPEAAGKFNL